MRQGSAVEKNELFFFTAEGFFGAHSRALRASKKAQGVRERAILPLQGSRRIKANE
jgi:hypothetical protein